ncbi:MAG: sigma-70 family RNA polymerase sigma factor [Sedimentisphaerales bacterium]|nr:sigma-70 family RNA polymerase sigma factor [Sedimentisphaerales bacterium]
MNSLVAQKTQQLVMLARKGDQCALNNLCGLYVERIRRIARLRMGPQLRSQLESMDIAQDALWAAVRELDDFTYQDEGDFLRWVSIIVENTIRDNVDKIHAGKRDVRRQVPLDSAVARSDRGRVSARRPARTTTPSLLAARSEELDRLERAMDQLKDEYRQVILLAKIEGLSYAQIGRRLGKTPDAVGMLLSRAMVALTTAFEAL